MINFATLQGLTIPVVPKGYTQLEYIESSGTQYFDTGFKPNQNTRVVIDIETLTDGDGKSVAFYGCRDGTTIGTSSRAFIGWQRNTKTEFNFHYGTSGNPMASPTGTSKGRFVIDHNKGKVTVNGTELTLATTSAFQATDSMFLLAARSAGALDSQTGSHRLYSCKIYDNGTLVRNFVPCKNATGTVGLYDRANDVFYVNAGSGTFIAGPNGGSVVTQITDASGRVLWEKIAAGSVIWRPTATISCDATAYPNVSAYIGNEHLLINEEVSDGDATYLWSNGVNRTAEFQLGGKIPPINRTITSVTWYAVPWSGSANDVWVTLYIAGQKLAKTGYISADKDSNGSFDVAVTLINNYLAENKAFPPITAEMTFNYSEASSKGDAEESGVSQFYIVLAYE